MPDPQPPQSPTPPPDDSGCRRPGSARSGSMPIPGGAMGDEEPESRPLSPSLKPITLPSRSLTGRRPIKPSSRKHLPAPPRRSTGVSPVASPSEDLPVPLSRLPKCGRTMGTSPTRHPPWAPPRRPRSGRQPTYGRTPRASQNQERSQNPNPDSVTAPEKTTGTLCHIPTDQSESTSSYSTSPTASAKKKRKFRDSSPPPQLLSKSRRKSSGSNKRAEGVIQEEVAEQHLGSVSEEAAEEHLGLDSEEMAEEHLGSDSSTCSSPLREPQPPLVPIWTGKTGKVYYGLTDDRAALDAYYRASHKYQEKQARQEQLLTLRLSRAASVECYSPKQKEMFLNVAKSILILSSYLDGEEINRCNGMVLEWDAVKKSAVVLTSAWLICTNKPFDEWSDKDYSPEAKVVVHQLDGTTLDAQLLYFNKHYDVAFYEIFGESHLQILPLEPNLEYGQDLCVIARDKKMGLICKSVKVTYIDPCEYQHNHYQFVTGSIPKCGSGGALVDFGGKILGMLFCTLPLTAFIPSSLILRCLGLWRKFGRLARPQLGLKLGTVGFLDTARIELLSRTYGVTSGLIVGEVSAQCVAERLGIRVGDIILSCQGESVSTLAQLEEILLTVGEQHLEKSNDLSSKVDVEVGVFHVRELTQRVIHLTVELSDGNEVFHAV